MPRTLYHAYEAILYGLIQQAQATAGILVLADGMTETPHVLAQVGHLSATEWARLLKERPPDIFVQPLASTVETTALLAVYTAGQTEWSHLHQNLIRTAARSLEYLSRTGEDEIDWRQLTASHRILPVTEEELCRIVLDIHDGPVQKIFSALNRVNHLQHLTQHALTEALAHHPETLAAYHDNLYQVAGLLEASLTEIRTFLGAFRPPEFNQRPLLDVLEDVIIQHEELSDATVHFEADPNLPSVAPPVKIALYRILQEALSNAVRHGGVDEHIVNLWAEQDDVCLEVIDFGPGFKPPDLTGPTATERAEHIGLRGMRDRAQLVGGTFNLFSHPGQGTRINVRVPCYG
jgi:signal transduction histidine kinase